MEKKITHYNLDSIKKLIKNNKYRITNSARVEYSRLGFCDDQVIYINQYGKMYIQKLKKN